MSEDMGNEDLAEIELADDEMQETPEAPRLYAFGVRPVRSWETGEGCFNQEFFIMMSDGVRRVQDKPEIVADLLAQARAQYANENLISVSAPADSRDAPSRAIPSPCAEGSSYFIAPGAVEFIEAGIYDFGQVGVHFPPYHMDGASVYATLPVDAPQKMRWEFTQAAHDQLGCIRRHIGACIDARAKSLADTYNKAACQDLAANLAQQIPGFEGLKGDGVSLYAPHGKLFLNDVSGGMIVFSLVLNGGGMGSAIPFASAKDARQAYDNSPCPKT